MQVGTQVADLPSGERQEKVAGMLYVRIINESIDYKYTNTRSSFVRIGVTLHHRSKSFSVEATNRAERPAIGIRWMPTIFTRP